MRPASVLCLLLVPVLLAADEKTTPDTSRGDAMVAEYFRQETDRLTRNCLAEIETLEDWNQRKDEYRRQLFEMLGLDPVPEKTPLEPVVTGSVEHEDFVVENLHFQSRPGLYVTGNLYRPKNLTGKAPTILYVCGHGRVKKDGISYGNKTHYQHHGAWFARNGYVCLTIDTLQLGEIEGIHHGTYNHDMWWWNSKGYSSAACEAWNCIRALDYLETRPEVDADRFGVTGRSGGGAYSWWIAALDERIKVAVPVAGITSLHNHVVDGCVEGHCDCMYMVNTYQWDFPMVAALMAPRPLLISNTDKDRIFPLDGVVDIYFKVRKIYELYGKADQLGLQITEGPHKDTQELRVHAFHWFNKYLKREDPLIEMAAVKFFEPEQLKVFGTLPENEINTKIQESFTLSADPEVPGNQAEWEQMKAGWLNNLREKSFRGWPAEKSVGEDLNTERIISAERDGLQLSVFEFDAQDPFRLPLIVVHRAGLKPEQLDLVVLNAVDDADWNDLLAVLKIPFAEDLKQFQLPERVDNKEYESLVGMLKSMPWAMAYVPPRGIGPTRWDQSERKQTQHRRRFQLLGQTLDGMRVWDIRRARRALDAVGLDDPDTWLLSERDMAVNALYASLFEPEITRLDLWQLPESHLSGPDYLNVLRYLDIPQAVSVAAEKSRVVIYTDPDATESQSTALWEYPVKTAETLGWNEKQLQLRRAPQPAEANQDSSE